MKKYIFIVILSLPCLSFAQDKKIRHYIFFSRDREAIHDSSFYSNRGVAGAQITYAWKKIEPGENQYDFTAIEEDLVFLQSKGKKLFIQIQDVTFDKNLYAVPKYLLTDTIYHGGANAQYVIDAKGNPVNAGWVARRWDTAVARRFHLLLKKLAQQFDGRIEGINLPETAVDFPDLPGLLPKGFSRKTYVESIKKNMSVLKQYFKKSTPLLYANFMPYDSKEDLHQIYEHAKQIKIGMGGPDIKVYREAQMNNSYPLIRGMAGKVATGVAVQEGNYSVINPRTGKPATLSDILSFAIDYLKLDYIFWCTEEPYYSKKVLPMLLALHKKNLLVAGK